jgi:hypothetical protein
MLLVSFLAVCRLQREGFAVLMIRVVSFLGVFNFFGNSVSSKSHHISNKSPLGNSLKNMKICPDVTVTVTLQKIHEMFVKWINITLLAFFSATHIGHSHHHHVDVVIVLVEVVVVIVVVVVVVIIVIVVVVTLHADSYADQDLPQHTSKKIYLHSRLNFFR